MAPRAVRTHIVRMAGDAVRRALADGAYHSLRACSAYAPPSLPARIWLRHKWKIIGLLLFLLIDFVLLGGLGSTVGTHF